MFRHTRLTLHLDLYSLRVTISVEHEAVGYECSNVTVGKLSIDPGVATDDAMT